MDKGITMIYTKQYMSDLESVQKCIPDIKQLQNCSIMVTGAGGLIGSAIMDFLIHANDTLQLNMTLYAAARNWEKIRKRFGAIVDRRDFVYVPYDAMKPFSMEAPLDYVIHTASPANPGMYASHPVETMLANLMGVNALLNYARTHELKRILYLSSSEVYGKKKDRKPYEEEALKKGNFVPITVFADVTPDMEIFQEEIFGPVLCVTPFETEEEAVALANATKFGLAGGVFTKDCKRGLRMAKSIRGGQIYVNSYFSKAMVESPGTGWKESGLGVAGIYKYMISKTIFIDTEEGSVPM